MYNADFRSFGPFHVTQRLGDGRFGPVYRVQDATGRAFVVRTVTEPLTDEQRVVLAAAWAAACAAPLDHPGIVKPVASGQEEGRPYIVHDWVDGEPLQRIPIRTRHDVDALWPALTRVAAALDFAAAAGVYHGALTAGDILIRDDQGEGAVVGLGVAQAVRKAGLDVSLTRDVESFARIVYASLGEQPLNVDVPDSALAFVSSLQRELIESASAGSALPGDQTVAAEQTVSPPDSSGRRRWAAVAAAVAAAIGFAGGYLYRDSSEGNPVIVAAPVPPVVAERGDGHAALGQMPIPTDDQAPAVPSRRTATGGAGAAPLPQATVAGALDVVSRPPGARVFLDGRLVGTTPLVLNGVPPGAHAVRLDLAAHRPWVTRFDLAPGEHARVAGSLER